MIILSPSTHAYDAAHVISFFRNFASDTSLFTLSEADVVLGEGGTVLVSF